MTINHGLGLLLAAEQWTRLTREGGLFKRRCLGALTIIG
jgi:hypothetical protein